MVMLYSSAIPNLVGHTIDDGRLRFTDIIGSGSNGVIFLAFDTTSPKANPTKYAVKCLVKRAKGTREYELQKQEIAYHKVVSFHPNVVTLHRVVEDSHYFFLVLTYCRGGDLFSLLSRPTALRGNSILVKRIYLQILDAVEACHNAGIFHRDIKPENILCSEDGSRIFLSDFGLATRKPFSMTFGAGSAYYMSPECIGEDVDRKAYSTRSNDIWALGVILTSMISGHNPWRHASYTDDCYQSFLRDSNFLRDMLPISSGADTILQSIFKHDPSSRICIPVLRSMVVEVDSFFLSAAEIAVSNRFVRKAAKEFFGDSVESPLRYGHDQETRLKVYQEAFAHSPAHEERMDSFYSIPLGSPCNDNGEIHSIPRSCPTNSVSWEEPSDVDSSGPATPRLDPHPSFSSLPGIVPVSQRSPRLVVEDVLSASNKQDAFTAATPGLRLLQRMARLWIL